MRGSHVFPVRGGQMKMNKHHGTRAAPMVKNRIPKSICRSQVMMDPTRRSSRTIDALTKGRMGILRRLMASKTSS